MRKKTSFCRVLILITVLSCFAASAAYARTTVRFRTVLGDFDVELFDETTPVTVTNFLDIVNRGDYDNSFIHRSVPGFIVQGGGFLATFPNLLGVPSVSPIVNEPGISNTRGTIAMAKLGDDPDSATTQWFFNLSDNSAALDNQNGGFTVFGSVIGSGMSVVDAIAAVEIVDAGSPFESIPLINFNGATITNENLVIIESITVLQEEEPPGPEPEPDPGLMSLYFPVLPQGSDGFNGLALLNRSSDLVQLGLELISDAATDRATLEVQSGVQVGSLVTEIFGAEAPTPAWIRLNSEGAELASFFQFGKSDFSQLDGGAAISEQSTQFYFTRVFDGPEAFRGQSATTTVSILNPNSVPAIVRLRYVSQAGGQSLILTVPSNSFLFEAASELFGENLSGGYIEVKVIEGDGAVGFEVIQLQDRSTVLGLNASLGNMSSQVFSAQLAIQDTFFTNVNLINTSTETRSLTITAVDTDGRNLGDPVQVDLEAGEQLSQDARILFGDPPEDFTGSLRVEFDSPGIVGDVIFGDSETLNFAASLPLQAETFKEAIFSQVANVTGFFTGVALFNPGEQDAAFTLELFRRRVSRWDRQRRAWGQVEGCPGWWMISLPLPLVRWEAS
ncbi:peptidylprolyl isomerase [Acidobacteria bacterium AH-259-D05]|nr:peptidylprolyl isomerase [Acidobacteria bacterium AH-259-D05]